MVSINRRLAVYNLDKQPSQLSTHRLSIFSRTLPHHFNTVEFNTLHLYGYLLGKLLFQWVKILCQEFHSCRHSWCIWNDRHNPLRNRGGKNFQHGRYSRNIKQPCKVKEHGQDVFRQPTALCPRCLQPGTCYVPGFPPWPLFFWLLPTLPTPLLTPKVPLQR